MYVHHGTPYASPAALAVAHSWRAYDPYLPALIAFGVPRVLADGLFTDPRIWFGIAFVITFWAAARIARVPRPVWWTVLITASPVVALPLAVGGDDLPVLGLMCLALALASRAARGNWPWVAGAGLAIGLAAAMKATAWPAVAVLAVLFAARQGWRAAAWFGAAVLSAGLVTDGIVVAEHPAAAVANTVLYPLGLAKVASPAASMLPGHMLAGAGTWGHWTALALLALAAARPMASPAPATHGQLPRDARLTSARPRHISPSTGRSSPPTASGNATTGEAVTSRVHHTGRGTRAIRTAAPNVATNAMPNQIRGSASSPPPSARGTPNTISAGRYGS